MPGPINGLGQYSYGSSVFLASNFYEYYGDSSVMYVITDVTINISYASIDTVIGNYSLSGANDTVTKTITGSFKVYDADIN